MPMFRNQKMTTFKAKIVRDEKKSCKTHCETKNRWTFAWTDLRNVHWLQLSTRPNQYTICFCFHHPFARWIWIITSLCDFSHLHLNAGDLPNIDTYSNSQTALIKRRRQFSVHFGARNNHTMNAHRLWNVSLVCKIHTRAIKYENLWILIEWQMIILLYSFVYSNWAYDGQANPFGLFF